MWLTSPLRVTLVTFWLQLWVGVEVGVVGQDCPNADTLNDLVNVTCPNDCSGHGACDINTATCACEKGWGSDADVADYKAPDCSQREILV